MASKSDLNQLQLELIKQGLCTEDEILSIIDAKRSQARKTRNEIESIVDENKCSLEQAYKVLKNRRKKRRTKK